MLQVLYRVPLNIAGFPLWAVLLVVGLGLGGGLWLLGRRVERPGLADTLRLFGQGIAVVGGLAGAATYFARDYIPAKGIPIYGFGMMLFLAFLICTWLAGRRSEREGISRETIQDLAIWVFVGGLLGARTTYLLSETKVEGVWDFISRLPRIWDGGIVLYGSILGALASYFIAYFLFFHKRGLSTRRLADVSAPCIALGLCLGRLGCFLNGCCFGQVACADCALVPPAATVSFPLSAPPREGLVKEGFQTAAGFTLKPGVEPPTIDRVDPTSPAYKKGVRPDQEIIAINGWKISERAPDEIGGQKLRTLMVEVRDEQGKVKDKREKKFGLDALSHVLQLENWDRGEADVTLALLNPNETEPEIITFAPRTLALYPTQLYEVISMGLLMLVLLAYEPFRHRAGQVAAVLLVGYGIHRFLNEILRDDPRPEGFEKYGSIICVAAGVVLWAWLQWSKGEDEPVTPVGAAAQTPAPAGTVAATRTDGAVAIKPGP
jgi:prolipoprotein diacylglyceryltransferase